MFLQRDVIKFEGEVPQTHRVVWADQNVVWLFDLDEPRTAFSRWPRPELEERLRTQDISIETRHAHDAFHLESSLSAQAKARRDALLEVISPLVARAPEIFDDRVRGRAVAQLEKDGIRSAKTVHTALDRWWRRGMSADALVPSFKDCGKGAGKEGARKPGVKQPEGTPPGVPITPKIEAIFQEAIDRHYGNRRRNSLSAVHELMCGEHFVDRIKDRHTGEVIDRTKPEYAETGFPTLRQFRYWYSKHPDQLAHRRKRTSTSDYEKDNRGTTGSAMEHVIAAGGRFEIDATELEFGVVSEIDRRTSMGKPTYYQVVDVLTSIICGIYVGHEKASWTGASLAVRNVVEDKVAFAERFGVAIKPEEWPCRGVLPKRLLADNAEWKGEKATDFAAKSLVDVQNAAPLRGDLKGTVEGKFNLFKTEMRKVVLGLRRKNQASPYEVDDSRNTSYTLEEMTAAVIETVVLLNNRKIKSKGRKRAMIEAGVHTVPTEMWQWALHTGATDLQSFDVGAAEFALLPTSTASVTQDGLHFRKLYYAGPDPRSDDYARARQDGNYTVRISYDPLCTTRIFVHDAKAPGGFVVYSLCGDSKEYHDVTFAEVATAMAEDDRHTKNRQFVEAEMHSRFLRRQTAIKRKARASRPSLLTAAEVAREKKNVSGGLEREREGRQSALAGNVVQAEAFAERQRELAERRQAQAAASKDLLGEDDFNRSLREDD